MTIKVFAKINGESIRCEVLRAFANRITQRGYILIFSPFETEKEVLIPITFDLDIDIQEAALINDEQDKRIIEHEISKSAYEVQYLPDNNITFQVFIKRPTESEIAERIQQLTKLGLPLTKGGIDEAIKKIDARIAHLAGEEYFSGLEQNDYKTPSLASGLILSIVQQDVLLTHVPINIVDTLLTARQISVSEQEMILLKAFQNIIVVFGKSIVVKQDVENALVVLAECENCSRELYDAIIEHKTFAEVFSGDVLQSIRYNVVLRIPAFFDVPTIKVAANYFYSKKEYENALKLFCEIYEKFNNETLSKKEVAIILNSIGCCHVSLMQFNEAYDAFKRATDLDDKFAAAYNNWAYTISVEADTMPKGYKRHEKLQEALVHINDAIQFDADDVSFLSNRSFIEYELGQYERVIKEYARAQEKTSKYSDISTILKLKIDSQIKQFINSPQKYPLRFADLHNDLQHIFANESSDKLYFTALDVFKKISSHENAEVVDSITLELVMLEFYIKELMAAIAIRDPHQEIYYYTSMGSIKRLLCDEDSPVRYRLPIFSANHMNDPSEGQELEKAFLQYVGDEELVRLIFCHTERPLVTKRRRIEAEFTFLKAFTKNDDSLPMWVHYADAGNGCCVKVNPHFFTNFDNDLSDDEKTLKTNPFDNEYRLYEILYMHNGRIVNSVPNEVNELFENMFTKASQISSVYKSLNVDAQNVVISAISKMINKLKYLFKSSDYAYEKEMRIVLRRPLADLKREDMDVHMTDTTVENPIPKVFIYTDKSLSVEEIILGPKVNETDNLVPFLTMKLLELNEYDSEKVYITKSAIEYR